MESEGSQAQVRDLVAQLESQIPNLPTLLSLLAAPLECIGLLPPQFRQYNKNPLPLGSISIKKHISLIQRILLTKVLPTWDSSLQENGTLPLLEQHFCPGGFANALPVAGEVSVVSYGTLVSLSASQMTPYLLRLLGRLAREYPIDRLFVAVFSDGKQLAYDPARGVEWEDCVKTVCMVPAKVANAVGTNGTDIPSTLENGVYFNHLSVRTEELVFSLSSKSTRKSSDALPALAYLLQKLTNIGLFPSSPPVARSQPSFFQSTLPTIRKRLQVARSQNQLQHQYYSAFWSSIFKSLPSIPLQSILASILASLVQTEPPLADTPIKRVSIKREAAVLDGLVGKITPEKDNADLWEITTSLMLSREWHESYARIFVCWVAGVSRGGQVNWKALDEFLEAVLEMWSSPEHIKHSLISRHRFTTLLLLVTVSYFPCSSPSIQGLVSNPNFLKGISMYISHLDQSVRRCGMLAGEIVAHICGKTLEFDEWGGDGGIKPWARDLRQLLKARDADAQILDCEGAEDSDDEDQPQSVEEATTPGISEIQADVKTGASIKVAAFPKAVGYDSDDSMTGYASPPSSRSASPSSSELAEIEKDPTLSVGVKKVPKPMYLAQLGELLRGGGPKAGGANEPHEADKVEMALNCAEELIRKKRGYGTELDENAVNLVYALLSLQDNFDLDGFSEKRQGAMNALVACSPRKAPPALIEEFFKNQYSADQRFVALNALAIGARELASLPVPPSSVPAERTAFPSKTLPAPLHKKYIESGKANTEVVPLILDQISKKALSSEQSAADNHPELVRERRLRIQKPSGITDVSKPMNPFSQVQKPMPAQGTRFIDVAAEFFIVPFVSRFWSFLRDEQTREERTFHKEGYARYRGAGTGLILNALILSQFLRTLAILVNASQNASEWLAIVAPDALELAVTLGTRPVSLVDDDEAGDRHSKEASMLTAALELALVVLDGALEIDGGRILGLEHTTLVLGVGEWAVKVFDSLEKGLKVQGGGGSHEAKLNRAAAGVLLKVDELTSKWRRSMLDTR